MHFEKTTALCDSFLDLGVPGYDLTVYMDGECVLRQYKGYSDRENRIPMRGDELYNIYSCSKPITCTAAMQLWEKGLFRLEDRVEEYLPEYAKLSIRTPDGIRPAKEPVRIRHLFEMTAGLSYDLQSPSLRKLRVESGGRCPTREVARALAGEPLCFEPGAEHLYSLCHDVLAALTEEISGQRFEDYVHDHIFAPLGMTHSDFLLPIDDYDKVIPLYRGGDASGKITLHPEGKVPDYRFGTEHASGGAGCVSTAEDYMKFLEALRQGDIILGRDTLSLMTQPRLTRRQRNYARPGACLVPPYYSYGLGLRVPLSGGRRRDFGWGGAGGAYLAVDIPHRISVFYTQHVIQSPNSAMRGLIYDTVLEELTGERLFPDDP